MHFLVKDTALRRQTILAPKPFQVNERALSLAEEQMLHSGDWEQIQLCHVRQQPSGNPVFDLDALRQVVRANLDLVVGCLAWRSALSGGIRC